ncbi:MAG: Smr/MutS family protein [Desulfovermiculus sp.]|nr:Smr/MutS family protein [Desulfovermiculus sp.]
MRFKDFKDLPPVKQKQHRPKSQDPPGPSGAVRPNTPEAQPEETEEDIFLQAMQGVKPLKDNGPGRKIPPKQAPPDVRYTSEQEQGKQYLQDLVQGKVEFDIQFTDEYLQASVRGLNHRTLRQLKSGEFSPEAYLDLHGLNSYDAHSLLLQFIKENYLAGKRCLLVIPGRGKNSPAGRGVLKEQIQYWLIRDPFKRVLLAFTTAQPQHGGAGALYLLLRKYKKSRGKIFWERLNSEIDM